MQCSGDLAHQQQSDPYTAVTGDPQLEFAMARALHSSELPCPDNKSSAPAPAEQLVDQCIVQLVADVWSTGSKLLAFTAPGSVPERVRALNHAYRKMESVASNSGSASRMKLSCRERPTGLPGGCVVMANSVSHTFRPNFLNAALLRSTMPFASPLYCTTHSFLYNSLR